MTRSLAQRRDCYGNARLCRRCEEGRRKAIPGTCGLHRGPIGFANLMVNERDGTIVFDPM
jgi:hypothetical protein